MRPLGVEPRSPAWKASIFYGNLFLSGLDEHSEETHLFSPTFSKKVVAIGQQAHIMKEKYLIY